MGGCKTSAKSKAKNRIVRSESVKAPVLSKGSNLQSDLWIYLGLLVVTIFLYSPVRSFDFVNYDDPEYVRNAHTIQGITPDGIRWALTSGDAANWFPLTRISHMVDVQLFGLDAGMHHLTNVLFHALATVLLFAFLRVATQARWPSAFVAFIFAVHPLHVESVAWVAERKDVLNAFFWFLTLWSYTCHVKHPGWRLYSVSLVAFCLGLLTKPMILTLPFVLLLIDYWPLRRFSAPKSNMKKIIAEKLPFFALSLVVAVVTYLVQASSRAVKTLSVFPLELRLENALVTYATYLEKTFWPDNLAVFYPYPAVIAASTVILAALLMAAVSMAVFHYRRAHPYLIVGWLWFIGTLIPVIGFVQVGAQARADRYMYVPMVGLLIMIAWGVRDVMNNWPRAKPLSMGLAILGGTACVIMTITQISYWRNSESLFTHALAVTNGNYVAEHNVGLAISETPGRLSEAIAHYRTALAIRPDSVEARTDLGSALAQLGQFDSAIDQYHIALKLAPDCTICRTNLQLARTQMAEAAVHLGVKLQQDGHTQEAIAQFKKAIEADPGYAEAHNDLGVALGSLGQTDEAIQHFSTALKLKPDYADARYNFELATKQKGSK